MRESQRERGRKELVVNPFPLHGKEILRYVTLHPTQNNNCAPLIPFLAARTHLVRYMLRNDGYSLIQTDNYGIFTFHNSSTIKFARSRVMQDSMAAN